MAYGRNRRAAKRIARSLAVRAAGERARKMGLTLEEEHQAEKDAHHAFNTSPSWRVELRDISAKHGDTWGKIGIGLGTVIQAFPGIGTVVGAGIIGIGTAHVIASEAHDLQLRRENEARANTEFLLSDILSDVGGEPDIDPPIDDYEAEDFESSEPEKDKGLVKSFLGGLYLSFFAEQAKVHYYQTAEYKEKMEDLRELAMQRGVSVAYLREEYRRQHGSLEGTIFDYTLTV